MPLFHIGGLSILVRSVLAGSSVALHERFDAAAVARALDAEGITRVSFVATMLEQVIEQRGDRPAPDGLALVLLGGGPASQNLLERARSLGYPVAPTYGLTEAASQVATRPPDREVGEDLAGGLEALPGVELRVVRASDASKKDVEHADVGEVGEIEVRGSTVMRGYLDDPTANARVLREGWLATGDLGWLDAQGRLRVVDRRADLIVSGGENVYPAEIESVLVEHPDVVDAAVVGVSDATYGEVPVACVVTRPDREIVDAELVAFCRERLAGYKIPKRFRRVEALPRTASGKLLRRVLAS